MAVGGYDYAAFLVDRNIADNYTCRICLLILRDPQITRCGHRFCLSCLQQLEFTRRVEGNNFSCPFCRTDLTNNRNNYNPDDSVNGIVQSLRVYCKYAGYGCSWTGNLINLEDHLQDWCPIVTKSCDYSSIGCNKRMKLEEQDRHNAIYLTSHLQLAVEAVNKNYIKLCNIIVVLAIVLAIAVVLLLIVFGWLFFNCGSIGTTVRMEELNLKIINEFNSKVNKLNLRINEKINALQISQVSQYRHGTVLSTRIERLEQKYKFFKLDKFSIKKNRGIKWYFPGFYTSPGGYKLSLRVDANGTGDGEGTHISCFIFLMAGENDDILEWPFHGEVTIELLYQLENRNHHMMFFKFDDSTPLECKSRIFGRQIAMIGWGIHRFIEYDKLTSYKYVFNHWYYSSPSYLKDDTLYFRVSVKVTSNTKQWLVH